MTTQTIKVFAYKHDEMPVFHVLYGLLAFLSASMLSIGAFALLIVIHMVLDIVKYREMHGMSWSLTFIAIVHESLLDITLLILALVVSVYIQSTMNLFNITGIVRTEMSLFQLAGVVIPKFFIIEHLLKVFAHIHHYLEYIVPGSYKTTLSTSEKLYASIAIISLILLIAAPYITGADPAVIVNIVAHELQPFRL